MRNDIRRILNKSRGKIFTVKFRKQDGSVRVLNGRLGVKTKTGQPSSTAHIPKYLTVYDVRIKAFRTVNLDTVETLSVQGVKYNA